MKKRKVLLLIPFAGLILSGCTFQDGISWIGQNIYTPVKDWITNLFNPGKKDEEKKEEEKGGEEGGGEEEVETVIGSIENPVSASEFCAKADELIDFNTVLSGKSETCKTTLFFVEGKVTSSSAMSKYGEIEYLNMVDTENNQVAIVGHFTIVDSSITDDYSEVNSLQTKTVVVKGYACLFNHSTNGKTYQLAKKDNDHKPTVVKVTDGTPTPGVNYGTLENPLTTSEAWALLDSESPSNAEMYVGGTVVSNTAWSTKYNNIDIVITDGVKEFTIYRAAAMPSSYSIENSKANDLEGYTLVAAGIGKIYTKDDNTTYELDQGCVVMSLVAPEAKNVSSIVSIVGPEEVLLNHEWKTSEVTVTVMFEGEEEPGTAKVLSVTGDTDVSGEGFVADVTIEGWEETLHFTYSVSSEARNYGTLENPLSVSEALAIITDECPSSGDVTKEQIYCEGEVTAVGEEKSYGFNNVKVSDGQSEVLIYSLNLTAEQKADFGVGKVIKFHGYAKNYNGTLEFASNGSNYVTVDEVIVEAVPVTGISLDKDSLEMEVGMPDETLVATVSPENATNKAVEWESANPEVATVNDGVVHAVAVGETTVTVTSVEDPTKSATCSVTVSEKTKELVSVQIKTMPKVEYTEGDTLDLSDLVLTLYYDDQSTVDVTTGYTTNIALDHELTTDDTELIITYGEFGLQPITLTITAKAQPVHAGTAADPYTVSDAKIVFDDLTEGAISNEVYVTGTIADNPVPKISGGRGQFYLTDGSETDLYVYNINNIGGSNNLALADIPAGSVVVAKGGIKNYQGTFEFCYNKENPAIACELISVDKPVIIPASVTISGATSVQEEKTITLTAAVGPVGAPQDVVWSVESGSEHASVDQNGVVAGIAEGAATIRATAVDHSDVYGEYNVSVTAKPDTPSEEAYRLVTNASDLADGSTIIISNNDSTYAMGAYADGNNVPAVAVTASEGVLEPGTASVLTLEDAGNGHFYIKLGSGYLYAAASGKNQLKVKSAKDSANGVWEFSYSGGHMSIVAYGSSNRNVMQFNANNGSPIFACYASASQTALQVYRYC